MANTWSPSLCCKLFPPTVWSVSGSRRLRAKTGIKDKCVDSLFKPNQARKKKKKKRKKEKEKEKITRNKEKAVIGPNQAFSLSPSIKQFSFIFWVFAIFYYFSRIWNTKLHRTKLKTHKKTKPRFAILFSYWLALIPPCVHGSGFVPEMVTFLWVWSICIVCRRGTENIWQGKKKRIYFRWMKVEKRQEECEREGEER